MSETRDLLAKIEQLENVLGAVSDELAAEIDERYPPHLRDYYPDTRMKYERDMSTVWEAWRLLDDPARPVPVALTEGKQ